MDLNIVSKHLTDTIVQGNNLIKIYNSLSNKSINKIVINTSFLAGIIWSQNDPSNFIFYPMSSMLTGIIYGGITSVTSRIIIKFLPNNFKPFLAGLIGISTGIYLMSQFYKKLTNQLEDDYIIYSIVRERKNDLINDKINDQVISQLKDQAKEKIEDQANDIDTDEEIEINTEKTIEAKDITETIDEKTIDEKSTEEKVDIQESIDETNKNIDENIFDGKYEFDFSIIS